MNSLRHLCAVTVLVTVGSGGLDLGAADALDWHHWRGPDRNGSATGADPPIHWSPTENVKWKVAVPGKGSATPIVVGDQIFVATAVATDRPAGQTDSGGDQDQTASADQSPANRPARPGRGDRRGGGFGGAPPAVFYQFVVLCYDLKDGAERWRKVAAEAVPHEAGHNTNSFASASPVTDGGNLYVSFGSYGIYSYTLAGELRWKQELGRMETRNQFGEGASPALFNDILVVPWDHEGPSFIAALGANDGEILWKQPRDERTTWATPLITEYEGQTQVITNGSKVRSYELQTGELIWECGGQVSNPIPTPLRYGDQVICMTGYRGNAIYSIPLSSRGDVTDSDTIVWDRHDAAPYVPSPVLCEDTLYFTKSNQGIVVAVNAATGEEVLKAQRLPEIESIYSSLVTADERIYITSREGQTVVLEHAPELKILATNSVGEGVDASLVLLGQEILIRGQEHLFCIAE